MSRTAIRLLVIWSVVCLGVAAVLFILAAALVVSANGLNAGDLSLVDVGGAPAGVVVGSALLAILLAATALVLALVAWIGALIETASLPDKGWFVAILVLGVLGMTLIADLVYVIGSPGLTHEVEAVPAEERIPTPTVSGR